MDYVALKAEINSRADCAAALTARNIDSMAATLSVGRKAQQTRFVTARTILAECSGGGAILDALDKASVVVITAPMTVEMQAAIKWALKFLGQDSGLDVGNPATQGLIDACVSLAVLTAPQGASLKSLSNMPLIVSRFDVSTALYNSDGTLK